jgi:hypothetical protein
MTGIKEYIETKRDYRLMAEYDAIGSSYLHMITSLNKALEIFEAIGNIEAVGAPNVIKECVKGGKRIVWDKLGGWGMLEKALNRK